MHLFNAGPEAYFEDAVNHMAAICGAPLALLAIERDGRVWRNRIREERGALTDERADYIIDAVGRESVCMCSAGWPKGVLSLREQPRAYISTPLTLKGEFIGVIVIADTLARAWSRFEVDYMARAARLISNHIEACAALAEHSRALEELSLYRTALDRFAIISMTDSKGVITYANDQFCSISGYRRDELIGANHRILNSGQHDKAFFVDMWRTIGGGQVWRGEICNRAKNGETYWVDSFIAPMFADGDGRPSGYLSIRYDRTPEYLTRERLADALWELTDEREKLESRVYSRTVALRDAVRVAEEANAAKSMFLATMSHELRTPLHAIIGYAEILEEEAEGAGRPGERADAERIAASGRHLLSLINDILDFSKIESGRMTVEAVDFDVDKVVAEVGMIIRPMAERRGTVLKVDVAPGLPRARTDPIKVRQCLINLLSNAVKFTENGEVTVSIDPETRAGTRGLRLQVRDTGIGMDAEAIARLFRPFTQADQSTTRKFGGTGLGLAITKQIVAMLGGEITVESAVGEGSTFRIWIPLYLSKGVAADAGAAALQVG